MTQTDVDTIKAILRATWDEEPDTKAKRYIGEFFDHTRTGRKIMARVEGNHGIYTVSIHATQKMDSACSCYIGGNGFCHHCEALAFTFLDDPASFTVIKQKTKKQVRSLDDLSVFLKGTTLASLIEDMKAAGITQKAFAESIGMSPRHLTSIKSSELRHHYYHELGATKLACLWVLEHVKRPGRGKRT